jgi:ABC-2 type transport system permease protein
VTAVLEILANPCPGCAIPSLGPLELVEFLLTLLLGGILLYCFWLMLTSIAFWIVRVDEMVNLFQGIFAAGRWPVGIYPDWLRSGLTFLVPVAFAVTVPAEALIGRLNPLTVLGAFGLTVGFGLLSRLVWRLGARHYAGASA